MIALEANHQCASCREHTPLPAGEADHVFPWSLGGPTVRENGKWLCRDCNGAKSDLVDGLKLWPQALRKWQQEFGFTFNEQEERNFLLYADPGAGKTVAALNVMAYSKLVNETKRFIYVVPSRSLRRQVIRSGNDAAALGIHFREAPEVTDVWHWPATATCLVVTMNFLNANRAADLRRLCDNDTVVIIDEVHHLSDDNEFGKHAKHAFERARRILGMTGTPWRTDGSPIPFFRYENANRELLNAEEKYVVATGFEVTWSDCWKGKYGGEHPWVRVPVFKTFDGEWELNGEHYESVEEIRDEIGITRAYCSSYERGFGFEQNKYSWQRLQEIRKHEPDAAELIVCSNIDQAKRVVQAIRRDRGYTPVLVSSDDEESGAKLERFATSNEPTIVAVRMVLEGVDIPRLRIVNYQSFITTLLTMKQVLARAMRVRAGEKVLDCFMFGPNIDCFVDFSASIELETMNALKVRSDDLPEIEYQRERDGEQQDWTSYFEITAKDGWLSRTITRGESLDTNEVEEFRRKASASNYPELASMAESVYHVMNSGSVPPDYETSIDVEEERKRHQKEIGVEIRKVGFGISKQPKYKSDKGMVFALLYANALNVADLRDRKVDGLSPDEMKKLHWVVFNTERWKRERL
jgi:superfamily II DNA or RNA helicase